MSIHYASFPDVHKITDLVDHVCPLTDLDSKKSMFFYSPLLPIKMISDSCLKK